MKKIPTVIDKCSDCPYCHAMVIKDKFRCDHPTPKSLIQLTDISDEIPEWCPLEDAIETIQFTSPHETIQFTFPPRTPGDYNPLSGEAIQEAIKLANLEEAKRRAERSLKLVQGIQGIGSLIDKLNKVKEPRGNIITRYMRKERGRL